MTSNDQIKKLLEEEDKLRSGEDPGSDFEFVLDGDPGLLYKNQDDKTNTDETKE